MLSQPLKEQSSLSDIDTFVNKPPQLDMDEVAGLQATNYIQYKPSPVIFEPLKIEESTGDQLLLSDIDLTVTVDNNSVIGKSILSNKEQVPETVSHLSTPEPLNTSNLTMCKQQFKEQCSSSDNDIFVKRVPQLDKVTSQQSTNCISFLQNTKPINEQISLSENNALVIDSVNFNQLRPQLHDCTTLQCPHSLQLKYLTMLQSVRNQLLLERISCHSIVKTKNIATSLNTICVTNVHEQLIIGSTKKVEHKETQFEERSVNRQIHVNYVTKKHPPSDYWFFHLFL